MRVLFKLSAIAAGGVRGVRGRRPTGVPALRRTVYSSSSGESLTQQVQRCPDRPCDLLPPHPPKAITDNLRALHGNSCRPLGTLLCAFYLICTCWPSTKAPVTEVRTQPLACWCTRWGWVSTVPFSRTVSPGAFWPPFKFLDLPPCLDVFTARIHTLNIYLSTPLGQ